VRRGLEGWTYDGEDDSARVLDADAEGFEDFDLRVVSVAAGINQYQSLLRQS
jgi:hypothetical protein